jgi:protein TonB
VSRAPKRPDGWRGPDDGPPKALRLVEAPEVEARNRQLFPFSAAMGIATVVVSALALGGTFVWTKMTVMLPDELGPIVVLQSVPLDELEEESVDAVARQLEALPPPPKTFVPIAVETDGPGEIPMPEVVLNEEPFEVPEDWEDAAKPFSVPEPPTPVAKPKPQKTVAKKSPPKRSVRKAAPVRRSPQVARQVPPVYPAAARRAGVEGSVLLQVAVESNGRAGNIFLVSSSGSGLLDAAAMRAVRKWSFRPATLDGQPTSGQVRVPVRFQLQ